MFASESFEFSPSQIKNFGDSDDAAFVFVTNDQVAASVTLKDESRKYRTLDVISVCSNEEFIERLPLLPRRAHILVALPNVYFASPPPSILGSERKLAVLACYSTPTSLDTVRHFLLQACKTDPSRQDQLADRLFSLGSKSEFLSFKNSERGTSADFWHLGDNLEWHEQIGTLDWGEQQLLPSGEVSTLPVTVFGQNIDSVLKFSGSLALEGHCVLHSGSPSFLRSDQARLYESLRSLSESSVIATIANGKFIDFDATSASCQPAADTLRALCDVDSRYRTLIEIGFGVNTNLDLFPGNSAMNEVYGGKQGVVHFGIGLIPYTQYHLDILCPQTAVFDSAGIRIFGGV